MMALVSHQSPPWKAYAVSQYWHRSGQPVSRTKTVGMPTLSASPCRERNISVILKRDTGVRGTVSSVRVRGHMRQSVCRQLCGIGTRELLSDVRERLACSVEFLQLVLREAEFQHRIRC